MSIGSSTFSRFSTKGFAFLSLIIIILGTFTGCTFELDKQPVAEIDHKLISTFHKAGDNITFNGEKSKDPEGKKLTYKWDFGDGNTSTEKIAVHKYRLNGTYKVSLRVSDGNKASVDKKKIVVENYKVLLKTSKGDIVIELYKGRVPRTVENFLGLVEDEFYDDLIIHRVSNIDSTAPNTHIIQTGGYEEGMILRPTNATVPLEIDEGLTHVDGAVVMARGDALDSATSQFYICDGPNHFLDDAEQKKMGRRGYAVFGQVVEGMTMVKVIGKVPVQNGDVPVDNIFINITLV